jgi:molybdate transport system substrate-binding protein
MLLVRSFIALLLLCATARADTITVSAAISLNDALSEATRAYEKETGEKIELNSGSSGQLMTQVRRGAPVDVFISAADEQMDQLEAEKLIDAPTRFVLASNRLVLIVPGDLAGAQMSFEALADKRFRRIAIGHPDSVPAGTYAVQVLTRLGILDVLRGRLIHGANVRQVLRYVERGEVEAGVVYRTDVTAGANVSVIATADESWHEPIRYSAALVSSSHKRDSARRFLAYLRSEPAREVLSRHGFAPPPPPATQPVR